MRVFVGAAIVLLVVWAGYMASPYAALWGIAGAIERGDAAALLGRINIRALRIALSKQLAGEEIEATGRGHALSVTDRQIAAAAIAATADPVMEHLLTAEGVLNLLRGALEGPRESAMRPDGAPATSSRASTAPATTRLLDLLGASRWRGFRNVYFSLPPDRPADARFRLHLRLSRLTWRIVSIELPAETRRRLASDLVRRARSNQP